MKLIIAIVGQSGTGKTTLGRYLSEKFGYRWVSSYTTRKMRDGETDGIDHCFVDVSEMPERSEMMAYTLFGGNHYWTTIGQFGDGANVYVIDEKGLLEMEDIAKKNGANILSVYVRRNNIDVDSERIARDNDRMVLDEDYYDIVLDNDADLSSFLESSSEIISREADKVLQN